MRLLLITDNFPNPWEPTRGVFNLEMARALSRDHDLRVVSPVSWLREWKLGRGGRAFGPGRRADMGGVEVHYPRYYYTPRVLRSFYGSFLWASVRGTVLRLLKEQRPEAVLGYWAHPDGEVAVRAARRAGVPAVVMVGGSDVLLLTREPSRRRCILRVLRDADAVVTTSADLRAKLLDFGIDPGKVHVVHRGVDRDRFHPGDRGEARRRLGLPAEGRVLLSVGRLVPVKGLDVLLAACARLRDAGLAFRLNILGDGPLRGALQAQAAALGLAGAVTFAGAVRHEELPDWYRAADMVVLASRSEGIPNVLREALACGTPFVASRVGGIPELAAGSGNRLVPPEDAPALAAALAESLTAERANRTGSSPPGGWEESANALVRVLQGLTCPALVG
jgi:glycosyltransferase involved in cell wall biosynthesis